eukprot:gene11659-biopygen412
MVKEVPKNQPSTQRGVDCVEAVAAAAGGVEHVLRHTARAEHHRGRLAAGRVEPLPHPGARLADVHHRIARVADADQQHPRAVVGEAVERAAAAERPFLAVRGDERRGARVRGGAADAVGRMVGAKDAVAQAERLREAIRRRRIPAAPPNGRVNPPAAQTPLRQRPKRRWQDEVQDVESREIVEPLIKPFPSKLHVDRGISAGPEWGYVDRSARIRLWMASLRERAYAGRRAGRVEVREREEGCGVERGHTHRPGRRGVDGAEQRVDQQLRMLCPCADAPQRGMDEQRVPGVWVPDSWRAFGEPWRACLTGEPSRAFASLWRAFGEPLASLGSPASLGLTGMLLASLGVGWCAKGGSSVQEESMIPGRPGTCGPRTRPARRPGPLVQRPWEGERGVGVQQGSDEEWWQDGGKMEAQLWWLRPCSSWGSQDSGAPFHTPAGPLSIHRQRAASGPPASRQQRCLEILAGICNAEHARSARPPHRQAGRHKPPGGRQEAAKRAARAARSCQADRQGRQGRQVGRQGRLGPSRAAWAASRAARGSGVPVNIVPLVRGCARQGDVRRAELFGRDPGSGERDRRETGVVDDEDGRRWEEWIGVDDELRIRERM